MRKSESDGLKSLRWTELRNLNHTVHHRGVHSVSRQTAASVEYRADGFRYPNDNRALQNVSFRIPAGQTVALVGPNGADKSPIIKLLLRLYDPGEGIILMDGIPLQRQVSVCAQDFG